LSQSKNPSEGGSHRGGGGGEGLGNGGGFKIEGFSGTPTTDDRQMTLWRGGGGGKVVCFGRSGTGGRERVKKEDTMVIDAF
jgi:hypothetical protein